MSNSPVVLLDLDGVVWRGDTPIAGADEAVRLLEAAGCRVAYFTNNSFVTTDAVLAKLKRQGVDANREEILSSAAAAATLLREGERALVVGGPGCLEALGDAGVETVHCAGDDPTDDFDAVVVGLDPDFNYARLAQAMGAILAGARLIGTNNDPTYPMPGRDLPGGGAILAAIATAANVEPVVAGKPNDPAADLVEHRLGSVDLVVGDRPSTDGLFARRLHAEYALVHSGVTPAIHGDLDPMPDLEGDDLLAVAKRWVGGDGRAHQIGVRRRYARNMAPGTDDDEQGSGGFESLKDSFRRFLETRSGFSGMNRSELEQMISDFLRGDGKGRERFEDLFEEFRARSRKSVDRIGEIIRSEVRKEFTSVSPSRREEIGEFLEKLVGLVGEYFGPGRFSRSKSHTSEEPPAALAKKSVAKSPAKRTAAKKSAQKQTAASSKDAAAKKSPAKKAPKKASPS